MRTYYRKLVGKIIVDKEKQAEFFDEILKLRKDLRLKKIESNDLIIMKYDEWSTTLKRSGTEEEDILKIIKKYSSYAYIIGYGEGEDWIHYLKHSKWEYVRIC